MRHLYLLLLCMQTPAFAWPPSPTATPVEQEQKASSSSEELNSDQHITSLTLNSLDGHAGKITILQENADEINSGDAGGMSRLNQDLKDFSARSENGGIFEITAENSNDHLPQAVTQGLTVYEEQVPTAIAEQVPQLNPITKKEQWKRAIVVTTWATGTNIIIFYFKYDIGFATYLVTAHAAFQLLKNGYKIQIENFAANLFRTQVAKNMTFAQRSRLFLAYFGIDIFFAHVFNGAAGYPGNNTAAQVTANKVLEAPFNTLHSTRRGIFFADSRNMALTYQLGIMIPLNLLAAYTTTGTAQSLFKPIELINGITLSLQWSTAASLAVSLSMVLAMHFFPEKVFAATERFDQLLTRAIFKPAKSFLSATKTFCERAMKGLDRLDDGTGSNYLK